MLNKRWVKVALLSTCSVFVLIFFVSAVLPLHGTSLDGPNRALQARSLRTNEDGRIDGPTVEQVSLGLPVNTLEDEEAEGIDEDGDDSSEGNDLEDSRVVGSIPDGRDFHEIFSMSTLDRKHLVMFFEGVRVHHPSVIPHPTRADLYIVVAQRVKNAPEDENSALVCVAGMLNDDLVCAESPVSLPVAASFPGRCEGEFSHLNSALGPRDIRLFYGPDAPYITYASHSPATCLATWLQDARIPLDAFRVDRILSRQYQEATAVRGPLPRQDIETNYFLFWDGSGNAYVHHEIWPKRIFAPIDANGTVGDDVASLAARTDQVCLAKYLPSVDFDFEYIRQATNSLAISLCNHSASKKCAPTDTNTFIMHIFHHEFNYDGHPTHEPYVLLFDQTSPFALRAISHRSLWIHGRGPLTRESGSVLYEGKPDSYIPTGHTENFYISSMSWKTHGRRYHGYLDDTVFLAFGIENSQAGVIDILASDLLQDLVFC